MEPSVIVAALIGLCLGALVMWLVARAGRRHAVLAATTALERENAALDATVQGLEMQLDASRDSVRSLADRAERESRVAEQLAPVGAAVQALQSRLEGLERQRGEQHGALAAQLRMSLESEERLRQTAESLASALSSNTTRGVWGETQLRRVVEAAGMLERVDFDTQVSARTDEGRIRPDMVVHLPGGKHLAIDAKVPFDAYLQASRIPLTASAEELDRRARLMQQHVTAMRAHIDQLAAKRYWAGIANSPEFVVAFIPSESLVSAALEADPSLMDDAFAKRVALASPVTLWSLLKSVAITWNQAAISDDALRVHALSQELYERVATLAGHAEKLRSSLESSVKHFNAFSGALESRVLVTTRRMARLDAPQAITAPAQIDVTPRPLTAPELTDTQHTAPPSER